MKKILEISSFYTSVPKIMIICYTVPEIWHVTHVIFIFHSGLFFTLLPHKIYPFTPQNLPFYPTAHKIKISKKVKKGLEISSFYTCVPTIMIRWCTVPETCCMRDGWIDWWTDGQMDGKSDIKRWVPYLKKYFHKQHWLDWDLMWNNNNLKYILKSK